MKLRKLAALLMAAAMTLSFAACSTGSEAPKTEMNLNKPYEEMTVEELQEAILAKMRKNGPVTEYMLGTVRENTHHGSLLCWVRSFR